MSTIQTSTGGGNITVNATTVWDRIVKLEENVGVVGTPIKEQIDGLSSQLAEKVTKKPLVLDALDYGLKTGLSNHHANSINLQAALDFVGVNGGGTVEVPPGDYYFSQPELPNSSVSSSDATNKYCCLNIRYSNVTLRGSGLNNTKFFMVSPNGLSLKTDYLVVTPITGSPYVFRGHLIGLNLKQEDKTIDKVIIEKIYGNGGCSSKPTNTTSAPSDVATGGGWDITNKAIFLGNDKPTNRIEVKNCSFEQFQGEIIYGGWTATTDIYVHHCNFKSSISGVSVGGRIRVHDNDFDDMWQLGTECLVVKPSSFRNNRITNSKTGLNIQSHSAGYSFETTDILDNYIVNCETGIFLYGAKNTSVRNNTVVDCYSTLGSISLTAADGATSNAELDSVFIENNAIIGNLQKVQYGIYINNGLSVVCKNIVVKNNTIATSKAGIDLNLKIDTPIYWAQINDKTKFVNCYMENNKILNTVKQSLDNEEGRDIVLPTSSTTLASTPSVRNGMGLYEIYITGYASQSVNLQFAYGHNKAEGNAFTYEKVNINTDYATVPFNGRFIVGPVRVYHNRYSVFENSGQDKLTVLCDSASVPNVATVSAVIKRIL